MTRRSFLSSVAVVPFLPSPPVVLPIHLLIDARAHLHPSQLHYFWNDMWPEAVSDLQHCGIQLDCSVEDGEVLRPVERQPVISGLRRDAINLVITSHIPEIWDNGLALGGVTTIYRGYHLCMIALACAHCHQIPFLSLNTCTHEMLHVLMQDIFEPRPPGFRGEVREARIDLYATRLWLFHDGSGIRQSAEAYLERVRPYTTKASSTPATAGKMASFGPM